MTNETLHTRASAKAALLAAGFSVRFLASDDESCDDAFAIAEDDEATLQVTDDDGVWFTPALYSGEGDDYQVEHGDSTRDPVEAAHQLLDMRAALIKREALKPGAEVVVTFNCATPEEFSMSAKVIEAQKDMPGFWFVATDGGSRFVISGEALTPKTAK